MSTNVPHLYGDEVLYKAGSSRHCSGLLISMKKVEWINYINERVRDYESNALWQEYIEKCFNNNVPVILNLDHLAYLLNIEKEIIWSIVRFTERFYREFSIPKWDGTTRNIVAPYPAL